MRKNKIKNIMKSLWLFFMTFGLLINLSSNVSAQNEYEVDIEVGTQNIITKNIPVKVKFKPTINSNNTEVKYDYGYGIEIVNQFENYFKTSKDEVYTVNSTIKPVEAGNYNITVTVTSWNVESNLSSSTSTSIAFNESLVVTPAQPQYTMNMMILMIVGILLLVGLGYLAFRGSKVVSKRFREWIKPIKY